MQNGGSCFGFDTDKMQPLCSDKVFSFYKKAMDNATEITVHGEASIPDNWKEYAKKNG